jgi:hypothetical protein
MRSRRNYCADHFLLEGSTRRAVSDALFRLHFKHFRLLAYGILAITLTSALLFSNLTEQPALAQEATPANLKIAFIGDQALGSSPMAVLNLIKSEGAEAVLHSGDFDYADNPGAWDAQINSVLGPNFPYFASIGNHDELSWNGPLGYQQYVIDRFNRLGISWSGSLGLQSTFHYKGLFFVITAPGIGSGFDNGRSDSYIRDQLAGDHSVWSICSWHKNMKLMQVGGKQDETGWPVYEEARKGGAIIATGHEHSYSRTHLLSSMINQTVASTSNTLTLTKGNTFAFVSGIGGHSIRDQLLSGPWWASITAANCLPGDAVCQPNAKFGALFGVFNVDGQPNKAFFYFKDISGRIIDSFTVISNIERPVLNGISPTNAQAGGGDFSLIVNGENFGNASVVQWNGLNRPTTFVSATQLVANISAADIATSGTASVTVSGPGGTSNAAPFTIDPRPVIPVIDNLLPVQAEAGGNAFTLTVNGQNFITSSLVRWNNTNRPTTFVSANQVTAAISAADIASAGTAFVTVFNPDGPSNAASFTISPPSLVLLTEENSEHAIALDSVSFVRDPFSLTTLNNLSSDQRTRLMLFSPNLTLLNGDTFANVSAQAEDAQHNLYPLTIEFIGKNSQFDWLTQIVIKLPDNLTNVTALTVNINYRSAVSNKALIILKQPAN